jgi:hypothetical protein
VTYDGTTRLIIDDEDTFIWKGNVVLRVGKPKLLEGKMKVGIDRVYGEPKIIKIGKQYSPEDNHKGSELY